MKPYSLIICTALLLSPAAGAAEKKLPIVEKLRNGFYVSAVDIDGRIVHRYMVDSKARLCFSSNDVIPCENLILRKEWENIITWVK